MTKKLPRHPREKFCLFYSRPCPARWAPIVMAQLRRVYLRGLPIESVRTQGTAHYLGYMFTTPADSFCGQAISLRIVPRKLILTLTSEFSDYLGKNLVWQTNTNPKIRLLRL